MTRTALPDLRATVQLILLSLAIAALALVASRLLPDRSVLAAEARAAGARADSIERVLVHEKQRVQDLQAEAQRAAAAHVAAIAAADAGARSLDVQIRRARAAARDSALTLETARAELERMASEAEAYKRLVLAERRAADALIRPLEQISARVTITYTAVAQLVEARDRQVQALEGQRSWLRRALELTCVAGSSAGGAALGTVAGGPGGAAIGAAVGVVGGALGCH